MNLELDGKQRILKTSARDFLKKECSSALRREMSEDPRGLPKALYARMGELGWFGLIIPTEYGGSGCKFTDIVVLLEEIGRVGLPGPFFATSVLGVLTLTWSGTEDQKRLYLPELAAGKLWTTLALNEVGTTCEPAAIEVAAEPGDGGGYVISGTKLFVPQANTVDRIIVAARTDDSPNPARNISLFVVDADRPGVTVTRLETISEDNQCQVVFDGVDVPGCNLLGGLNEGWPIVERVLDHATIGLCAQMVGGAQQALDMTVEYAKERMQFGRPIGSFQAVQQHCANMAVDVDAARCITYRAACALVEGEPGLQTLVSAAKAWTSDAYVRVTQTAHQVHGAIAFSRDYDLQHYIKAAMAAEPTYGDAYYHREKVARSLGI